MKENKLLTKYLFPVMLQIIIIALIAAILSNNGIKLGYGSAIGIILIVLSGVSSALWGGLYQCRCNGKRFSEIIKDFINIRQSIKSYLLVILFLVIDFGGVIISKGFQLDSIWFLVLLFLKALVFGGIEEIGWRYTFQPAMEQRVTYIPAVFITFICWGIWHFLFFYIDGSIMSVNVPFFLLGLLTNCFILSALYSYSGSLWICVMTHALINALTQSAVDDNVSISIILKIVCMVIAVVLYNKTSKKKM
ncbi:MAG: CPBP family intramembrane glutamic endopeptidase [Roseburia sp.]